MAGQNRDERDRHMNRDLLWIGFLVVVYAILKYKPDLVNSLDAEAQRCKAAKRVVLCVPLRLCASASKP